MSTALKFIFCCLSLTVAVAMLTSVFVAASPAEAQLKLPKIRLSDLYPPNERPSNRSAVSVVKVLFMTDTHYTINNLYDYPQSIGAINFGLKRLRDENILNISEIDVEIAHADVAERPCQPSGDIAVIERVYYELNYKFDAVVGPACAEGALGVAAFVESLKKPYVTWAATHPNFNNKWLYPHVVQNSPDIRLELECSISMLKTLGNWTRYAYLYESDDYTCANIMWPNIKSVAESSKNVGALAYYAGFSGRNSTDEQIRSILLEAAKVARVINICSSATNPASDFARANPYDTFSLRVLSQAFLLNMHTGTFQWLLSRALLHNHHYPPYAAIQTTAADLADKDYSLQPIIDQLKLPVTEAQLYEIYRSTLELDQDYGTALEDPSFDREVMAAAFQPPWNINRTLFDFYVKAGNLTGHAARFAGHLADAIYIYGRGLRAALDNKLDYTNSALMYGVFSKISAFNGSSGMFAINSDGKRLADQLIYAPVRDYYQVHPLKRFERRAIIRCASATPAERAAGVLGQIDVKSPLEWYGAVNNQPPPDIPVCGWKNENCQLLSNTDIVLVSCAGAFAIFLCAVLIYLYVRRRQRLLALLNTDWNLQATDLTWPKFTERNSLAFRRSNNSVVSFGDNNAAESELSLRTSRSTIATSNGPDSRKGVKKSPELVATYKGNLKVYIKPIRIGTKSNDDRSHKHSAAISVGNLPLDSLRELRAMKDADHDNINRFVGIVIVNTAVPAIALEATTAVMNDMPAMLAVTGYCSKGTLAHVLYGNEGAEGNSAPSALAAMFKFWFVNDIVNGLHFVHNVSALKSHGRLSSSSIVLDARWTAKLTDFGFWSFGSQCSTNSWLKKSHEKSPSEKLLWIAPEVLQDPTLSLSNNSTSTFDDEKNGFDMIKSRQAADIYSLGIVIAEILYQLPPYRNQLGDFYANLTGVGDIVRLLTAKSTHMNDAKISCPFRPEHPELRPENLNETSLTAAEVESQFETAQAIRHLMMDCWLETPTARPTTKQIMRRLAKMNKGSGNANVMDRIISKLEVYAENLENIVRERTGELMDEKQRADTLLSRMLPASVAERLKLGQPVVPEHFGEATIFFSDIVSFTTISGASTPMQVVQLLNDLYTFMDSVIEHYGPHVYKVETIGDAYMIVAGIPLRTPFHARLLASVALAILTNIEETVCLPSELEQKLKLMHVPITQIRIRVGLNSGPCVAGVVGLQMPRYCLFGDTVNVASRMESNGEAMRIHINSTTRESLRQWPEFVVEDRGVVEIKGKGEMQTYWLVDGPQQDFFDKDLAFK